MPRLNSSLPIDAALPELLEKLHHHSSVVLSAEPGAGKTTRVPVALLDADWLKGRKIIMLEPRRLAAQRAAEFIASQLNEEVGQTVGFRIRGEARVSSSTRIEILTEGILTRQLQASPDLPDVGILLFDEFHERSIHADLGLALALDVQEHLRPDVRILIMSATLDGLAISKLLRDAPIVQSSGRTFPVETLYVKQPQSGTIEPSVAATVARVLEKEEGDVLVFLPGQREIRRVDSLLNEKDLPKNVTVRTLFGDASPGVQRAALKPPRAGMRKVILSTSISETSVTIDGVRVVIDSGLSRSTSFDPRRGMSGLVTLPVSQASADQRRGRAGRQQPGVCYRLWPEAQHATLPRFSTPEILAADLAPLALELARWGSPNGEGLRFLDPPPAAHCAQATNLLKQLHALDGEGKLTLHGKAMAELPVHPRLSHMLLKAKELELGSLACEVAALLEERDLLRGERDADVDLHARLNALRLNRGTDRFARDRVLTQARRLRQNLGVKEEQTSVEKLGVLLALAYPERVAMRQGDRFQLASGTMAILPERSLLGREQFLAIGEVDGVGATAKIFLAEPVAKEDIEECFSEDIDTRDVVQWDGRVEAVVAKRTKQLGAMELSSTALPPESPRIVEAMLDGIREIGLRCLPWSKEATSLRTRSEWLRLRKLVGDDWIDLSEKQLMETLNDWLAPFLHGITRRAQLEKLSLAEILHARFSYQQRSVLNRLAPTHITVPTGSNIPLDYSSPDQPVLAVRMQEMFGEVNSPTVADGNVKVLLHLLSPARRPLAVTGDLASFWRNAYPDVRKEMRGRYPKHYWPEDPRTAEPTQKKKK